LAGIESVTLLYEIFEAALLSVCLVAIVRRFPAIWDCYRCGQILIFLQRALKSATAFCFFRMISIFVGGFSIVGSGIAFVS